MRERGDGWERGQGGGKGEKGQRAPTLFSRCPFSPLPSASCLSLLPGRASTPTDGPKEGVTKPPTPAPALFLAAFSAGAARSRGVDASPWNTFLGADLASTTLASAEGDASRTAAAARRARWRGAVVGAGEEREEEGGGVVRER